MPDTPAITIRPFNINDYAKLKLSPAVVRLWKARAQELREAFPQCADLWPDEPRIDADGFYRGQLWAIMHLVGPECVAGGSVCQDGLIYLEFRD